VRQRLLLIDGAIAAAVALLLLILSPGLAIAGLIALLALLVCGLSFAVGGLRRRFARRRPQGRLGRRGQMKGLRQLQRDIGRNQRRRASSPAPPQQLSPPPALRPTSRRGPRAPR
jgi:hypothetical protein